MTPVGALLLHTYVLRNTPTTRANITTAETYQGPHYYNIHKNIDLSHTLHVVKARFQREGQRTWSLSDAEPSHIHEIGQAVKALNKAEWWSVNIVSDHDSNGGEELESRREGQQTWSLSDAEPSHIHDTGQAYLAMCAGSFCEVEEGQLPQALCPYGLPSLPPPSPLTSYLLSCPPLCLSRRT